MFVSKWIIVPATMLLLASCQRRSETAPRTAAGGGTAFEGCRVGTALGADGHVTEAKTSFAAKEPIHLTIGAPGAAPKQQITVEVRDAKGEEIKTLWKLTDSEKIVTFPLRNLEAGRYTADVTWGKEKICDQAFEIH